VNIEWKTKEQDMCEANTPPGNNTYVFDSESAEEMARLTNLDRVLTRQMGGPCVGISDPSLYHFVLDLACGPGGWALDMAYAYPDMQVAGIDISRTMIDYANARARSQGLKNVSFGVMNITEPLDFADASFDLINARLLVAVLFREKWATVLAECLRLLRPGGVLRLIECDDIGRTTSPAFEQLGRHTAQFMRKVGYGFSPDGTNFGMSAVLPNLLRQAGFHTITYSSYPIHFFYGSDAYSDLRMNAEISSKNILPLLSNAGVCTQKEVQELHQRMLIEMVQADFYGTWTFWCVQGTKLL